MELDLEQARRRAKERLRAARRGDLVLRDDREPRLADAQRSVANELGFASWPALVAYMEATGGDRRSAPPGSCARRWPGGPSARRRCSRPIPAWPAATSRWRSCSATRTRSNGRSPPIRRSSRASCPARGVGRCRARATPRPWRPTSRARPVCGASSSCCSTRAPTRTRRSRTSTARCRCSTARRASRTTRRRRGYCSTAARTRTTASRSPLGRGAEHRVPRDPARAWCNGAAHERARQRAAAARHAAAAARAR